MNNTIQLMMQFRQFMQNPQQFMKQRGIPEGMFQSPNDAINWLMRNGKINQAQYNQAAQAANELKKTPQFQQMFGDNGQTNR